jgi:phenylacetate-CoA ligase
MPHDRWLPRLAPPLFALLGGRRPWAEARRLRTLQWRAPDELEARALARLRPLLEHAYRRVPHYRDLFERAGLAPSEIRTLADLARLPVTTKADLRAGFPDRVVDANLPARRRREMRTSGSTGFPLRFYADRAATEAWLGSYLFFREWAGVALGDAFIYVPGPVAVAGKAAWAARGRRLARRLLLGEQTLSLRDSELEPVELARRVARLPSDRPFVLWGFPSYLARLAARLLESGATRLAAPKVVVAHAETLSPLSEAAIRRAFRCPVVNHYSSWEVLHLAQTCPDNPDRLHVNSERAILTIARDDGTPAPPGEAGRVVITDPTNYVMPFVNYDIGDRAVAGPPCPCGRGFPTLLGIEGRFGEAIRTPAGRLVLPIATGRFLDGLLRSEPWIWECQIRQLTPDRIVLAVVPAADFTAARGDRLAGGFAAFLGPGVSVRVEIVERIEPEPSGKRLLVKAAADPTASA